MTTDTAVTSSLVLFDLDGTLIDTTELILASCRHTFACHVPGLKLSREALVATFGRSLPAVLREFAVSFGAPDPDALADEMLGTYRVHNDEHHDRLVGRFDGIVDMLTTLRADGHRLGVVTSKREQPARHGLRRDGLESLFDDAIFHDDTERHKPHPEPLLLAARRAGVPPRSVVYVGDSIHDIVAGRAAGMRTIAAGWGPFARAVLERERPDAIAERPADVPSLLHTLRAAV